MRFCFDLDGTLCETVKGDYAGAEPIVFNIRIVNGLHDQGHTIIIDTARGSMTGIDWYDLTKEQLESWHVRYHELYVGKKVAADVYIDDKGLRSETFFNARKQ